MQRAIVPSHGGLREERAGDGTREAVESDPVITGRMSDWIELLRAALGVERQAARAMFDQLLEDGVLVRRRHGVWGITYRLRREPGAKASRPVA